MVPEASSVPLYYHEDYVRHEQGPGHPESPERVREILRYIKDHSLPVELREPVGITESDLELVHSAFHIRRVRDFGVGYMDPDTFHTDRTFGFCLRAAGGVVGAVKQCITERRTTFAIPRPPGHHAGADYNMGFCYLNNVALSARMAQKEFQDIEKVAIVDIDAHHGNGTNDIFNSDPSVLYISTHEWGIFPGTGHYTDVGSGKGVGMTVNLPFNGGSGDGTFITSFREIVLPILSQFGPDLLLVSFGGDAHFMDPLTTLSLSTPGYLELVRSLIDIGNKEVGGRVCVELEGGYHTYALAESFAGAIAYASRTEPVAPARFTQNMDEKGDRKHIKELIDTTASYWKL
ncbi:MAG: histone deacetylase [Candidatus Thermoplasmatota archaeon]|nr:histone deacetylase [Candidatus Thermoplasmatota archaeon]